MMELSLGLKKVRIDKSRERKNELYAIGIFVAGDQSFQVRTEVLENVPRKQWYEFGGLGLNLVPPTEVPSGTLVVAQLAIMESDAGHREFGERMQSVGSEVGTTGRLHSALSQGLSGIAIDAVSVAFRRAVQRFADNKDDQLLTYAGSWVSDDVESGPLPVQGAKARALFQVTSS